MQFKNNFLALISSIDGDTIKERDVKRIAQVLEPVTSYGGKTYGTQWRVELKRGRCFPLPPFAVLNHRHFEQRELLERLKESFSVEPVPHIPPYLFEGASPLMRKEYAKTVELCDASTFAAEMFRQADEAAADLRSFAVLRTLTGIFRAHATTISQHGRTELSEQIEAYARAYIEGIKNPPRQYNDLIRRSRTARHAAAYGSLDPELHATALAIVHHNPNAAGWGPSLASGSPAQHYGHGNAFMLWLEFHRIDPADVQPRTRRKPPTTTRKGGAERRQEILARAFMTKTAKLTNYTGNPANIDLTIERLGADAAIIHAAEYVARADQRDGRNRWAQLEFFYGYQVKLAEGLEI